MWLEERGSHTMSSTYFDWTARNRESRESFFPSRCCCANLPQRHRLRSVFDKRAWSDTTRRVVANFPFARREHWCSSLDAVGSALRSISISSVTDHEINLSLCWSNLRYHRSQTRWSYRKHKTGICSPSYTPWVNPLAYGHVESGDMFGTRKQARRLPITKSNRSTSW